MTRTYQGLRAPIWSRLPRHDRRLRPAGAQPMELAEEMTNGISSVDGETADAAAGLTSGGQGTEAFDVEAAR